MCLSGPDCPRTLEIRSEFSRGWQEGLAELCYHCSLGGCGVVKGMHQGRQEGKKGINQAEGKQGMKNTLEMSWGKRTKWEIQ